jgi:hypothetical protein
MFREELFRRARRACLANGELEELVEDLAARRRDPYSAVESLLERVRFPGPGSRGAESRGRR